jgi:general secretion pathway protein C
MLKHSFTLLNLLFIGVIVYLGVNAFYLVTSAHLDQDQPVAVGKNRAAPPEKNLLRPLSHYNDIVTRNLFKTKATAAVAPQPIVNVEELEQTTLKLKLWGTVSGSSAEAFAVIEDPAKRMQNLYRVGDTVQDATVKMILREKVILNVKGKDEFLEIEKTVSRAGKFKPASSGAPGSSRERVSRRPVRTQKITLRRSQIEDSMEDVNQLLTQVNIRPHFDRGQPDGLMLSRIKPNSLFMRMGLRNGDVISGVNDQNLESVDDALTFYESLRSAENVTVRLKRGGRERKIEYTIR